MSKEYKTMTVRTQFPHAIQEIKNTWIPLSDGTRLAARIWMPMDAEEHPVPAILEYIPYRKDDLTALRDSLRHPYFAGHGYASIRVDMRGSGDSDGILYDEYLPQEQDDALEVLRWIATQPWCTGDVGMIGKSWGGFNGLQIAARRPPELKAVITLYFTDDRYADDVHYMGGCLLAYDMLPWASIMLAYNALPPDPDIVGGRWRDMWMDRMERTPPYIEAWLSHQRRDAFWKHGSVRENYADITCPVYAVGGWADAYTNAVLRVLEGLPGPRKGLIGPWGHEYPEVATPGPAIGFLQECLRWWDHWLKGEDTGIMEEPMLRAWVQDGVPPRHYYPVRPGRWVAEPAWPAPDITYQTYWLTGTLLADAPGPRMELEIQGSQGTGLDAGVWCPYGQPGDMALDQRAEDGRSLSFTSEPVERAVDVLGFPEVTLTLAADRRQGLVAVRLCDVAPDGASTLVSWGLLNLTHRESHEEPRLLKRGEPYTVAVRLNAAGYSLPVGHRWRVSVSPTYWPHAWPSPEPVTLTLIAGENSRVSLPVRPPRGQDASLPEFEEPETSALLANVMLRSPAITRNLERETISGRYRLVDHRDSGRRRLLESGLEFGSTGKNIYAIKEGDPLSASIRCERRLDLARGGWSIRIETASWMTADPESFHVTNVLDAYEGDTRVFNKAWTFSVPRDMV
jgi:putative CocE/NonD family hydrolase